MMPANTRYHAQLVAMALLWGGKLVLGQNRCANPAASYRRRVALPACSRAAYPLAAHQGRTGAAQGAAHATMAGAHGSSGLWHLCLRHFLHAGAETCSGGQSGDHRCPQSGAVPAACGMVVQRKAQWRYLLRYGACRTGCADCHHARSPACGLRRRCWHW